MMNNVCLLLLRSFARRNSWCRALSFLYPLSFIPCFSNWIIMFLSFFDSPGHFFVFSLSFTCCLLLIAQSPFGSPGGLSLNINLTWYLAISEFVDSIWSIRPFLFIILLDYFTSFSYGGFGLRFDSGHRSRYQNSARKDFQTKRAPEVCTQRRYCKYCFVVDLNRKSNLIHDLEVSLVIFD